MKRTKCTAEITGQNSTWNSALLQLAY